MTSSQRQPQQIQAKTDVNKIPSVFCCFLLLALLTFFCGCSDFLEPIESTPAPTEFTYNYWLLRKTYLYQDELKDIKSEGDSVQDLYSAVSDPFTRYVPPSKSEAATITQNTSIVQGDIGLEYILYLRGIYPLCITRVYPQSPAGRANVPRGSCIMEVNGVELRRVDGDNQSEVYRTYDSLLTYNKTIEMTVWFNDDTLSYKLEKEDVFAPTVFVDTLYDTPVISIKSFKLNTADRELGTYGELKAYLDSTKNTKGLRVLDLRGNPGGHVSQCTDAADLFIKSGVISKRVWRNFDPDGKSLEKTMVITAKPGDAGEDGNFVVLVNKQSASCAEIFTAAIAEGANIPVAGTSSYGKGIGQSTWHTLTGGLAIITNLEFITPKGHSYHKMGIEPQIVCDTDEAIKCAIDALTKKTSAKKIGAIENSTKFISRAKVDIGGAYIENEDSDLVWEH